MNAKSTLPSEYQSAGTSWDWTERTRNGDRESEREKKSEGKVPERKTETRVHLINRHPDTHTYYKVNSLSAY